MVFSFFFPTGEEKNHDWNINMNTAQNMPYQAAAQAVLDAVRLLASLHWRPHVAFSGYNFNPFFKAFLHRPLSSPFPEQTQKCQLDVRHGGRGEILPCFALHHCCWPGQPQTLWVWFDGSSSRPLSACCFRDLGGCATEESPRCPTAKGV